MKQTIRISMLGSALSVRGGISSVVRQMLQHPWSPDIQIEYTPTHVSGSVVCRCLTFLRSYVHLYRRLRSGSVDIVHLHMSQRGSFHRKYLLHRLARHYGVPVLLHLHGSEFMAFYEGASPALRRRIHRLLTEADRVLVLGDNWERNIRTIEPQARLYVLKNSVSIPRSTARWNEERTELLYLGVLIPRKGLSDLLQAMALLQQKPLPRPLHLTIAGAGEARQALEEQCAALSLQDCVDFVGWIDGERKITALQSSQCFVLPSYNEGLPVCILEAISCGVPTVSTNVGSVNEAVSDRHNGRLIPPGDPQALAEAIRWTVSDRDRWETLSRCAAQTAREHFDEQAVLSRLEEVYRSVCQGE